MNTHSVTSSPATASSNASPAEATRDDAVPSVADSYASWNSWGERNPFSMGSSGRF
jgi:hypothetical protein